MHPSTEKRGLGFTRRGRVAVALVLASLVSPNVAHAVEIDAIEDQGIRVDIEAIATIPDNSFGDAPRLNMMTFLDERLFIVEERDGLVYELVEDQQGALDAVVFFDVGDAIDQATDRQLDTSNVFHGGLRSIAFHPDFTTNGLLYVSVMETRPVDPSLHHYVSDAVSPIAADSALIEFTSDHDTNTIDPASYREVLRVGMPVYDHPIKQIAFDPEATGADRGLLFIGHGDGSINSATAGGGQNNDALGKILRIDPRSSGTASYSIPADNPFLGDPSMPDEVYSLGHRNPHQLSFAAHPTHNTRLLIVVEPGRDNVEEVNIVTSGADFGWPQREGTFVHLEAGGRSSGLAPLPSDDASEGFTYPAAQYFHRGPDGATDTGEAIAGGFVVDNGSALQGLYFFADFPTTGQLFHSTIIDLTSATTSLLPGQPPSTLSQASIGLATIAFDHDNDDATQALVVDDLRDVFDDAPGYETSRADVRFGQGPVGELYVMSKRNNTIYLVTNSVPPPDVPTPPHEQLPRYADDQILRLYRAALGRAPDEAGLRFWVDRYQSGVSLTAIATSFIASPEFTTRYGVDPDAEALVALLYQNVLGRPGETQGQMFWTDELRNDATRASVVIAFADSDENLTRTGTPAPLTSSEAKILRLYRASLGRTPDASGMSFWVGRYDAGMTLTDIAEEFRRSVEFGDRYGTDVADVAFVALLYQNVLDRDGEEAGTAFWLQQLAGGRARNAVLVEFSESAENLARTNTQP